jgi:hypothetical protein
VQARVTLETSDPEVAWTLKRIAEIESKRDKAGKEAQRFYEIVLRGWRRHLTYAREEAKQHRDASDSHDFTQQHEE